MLKLSISVVAALFAVPVTLAACVVGEDQVELDSEPGSAVDTGPASAADDDIGPALVIEPGESLADHGLDITDDEAARIEAIVLAGPTPYRTARAGGCVDFPLPDHIRNSHVGKTDDQLRARATQHGLNASSWATESRARKALRNLLNFRCDQILAWQRVAAVGASGTWYKSNTGQTGRLCRPSGTCSNVRGATMIYTKYFDLLGWSVGFVTTGYPVN